MKIFRRVLYWIAALGLVFVVFWFGFTRKKPQEVEQKRVVPVEVETVSAGSIEEMIELTGWIKANQVVDVASKVGGRLDSLRVSSFGDLRRMEASEGGVSVPVEEGVVVKKGQQVAVIDHGVYVAQVEAAKATVQASEVGLADAEREKKRITALYEGGSATQQNRDKAVTAAELAVANLNTAKANLELAQINLRESTIVSPIDGIVTAKHIDEGNLIKSGDRIVTITDMKVVRIVVAVAEKYGGSIVAGMPAKIKVDTFPDRVFDARVYSVYPALDTQTHMIQVEIRLDNPAPIDRSRASITEIRASNEIDSSIGAGRLKPGMFARVTLVMQAKKDVVVVSRDVVLGGKIDEPYVYVVENGIAHKRIVKLGITQADRCEIAEGLKPGEKLVVNGMHALSDGVSVELVRLEDIK